MRLAAPSSISLARAIAVTITGTLLLAGCSSQPTAGRRTTTTVAAASTTTTTTTVVPTTVGGTTESGALSYLGAIERIPVMAVPAGESATAVPSPGTSAYKEVVPIAYRQVGTGPDLVLIAGEDASMTWWSPSLLQALAQHYRVTIFDLPGVGYSGPPTAKMSMDWLGDVTAGLIGELGLSKPIIVGWGMGGQIALGLAERHNMVLSDLILVDTGVPTASSRPMTKAAGALLDSDESTPTSISAVMFPSTAAPARRAWLAGLDAQVPDVLTSAAVSAEASLEQDFWRRNDIVAGLSGLKLPVLAVGGASDAVFPPGDMTVLSSRVPGAQHYLWVGTGYGCLLQEPSHFARLLEEFTA